MTMTGYLAYWEDRLTFSPAPEDEGMFREVGHLALVVLGRTLHLVPDARDGVAAQPMDRARQGGLGVKYVWERTREPWARWKRHAVEVSVGHDDDDAVGHFTIEVDDDHLLPWPILYTEPGIHFDAAEVAVREFRKRAASAYLAGGDDGLKKVLGGVPRRIKPLIRPKVWTGIVNEVREMTSPWT